MHKFLSKKGDVMATIKDVAQTAGVSVGTVSRYLNGAVIKEKNKQRIDNAIMELDYKLNPIGRCLKTNKSKTIGVLIYDLTDIYATTIVKSIEQTLFEYGYNIIVCDYCLDNSLEREKAKLLMDRMIDGLIVFPFSHEGTYIQEVQKRGLPVVVVDWVLKDIPCDSVLIDNTNATYLAIEQFIMSNHKHIALINGSPDNYSALERLTGYKKALSKYGLKIDDRYMKIKGFDISTSYESFKDLMTLEEPPTAILACNRTTTLGLLRGIKELGLSIPDDLSIIGFDDLGLYDIVPHPLSIITQPMMLIGQEVSKVMLRRLEGNFNDFPSLTRLETQFTHKGSIKAL